MARSPNRGGINYLALFKIHRAVERQGSGHTSHRVKVDRLDETVAREQPLELVLLVGDGHAAVVAVRVRIAHPGLESGVSCAVEFDRQLHLLSVPARWDAQ